MQSIVANLTPALACQDHTTSPSASASLVWRHQYVHRIPRPTLVTIAKRPFSGRGTRRNATDLGQPAMAHGCGRLARRANRASRPCVFCPSGKFNLTASLRARAKRLSVALVPGRGLGVAIYGRPNLPLCAPLQPASPVLVAVYVEVGATVRADIAMAVMLGLRLTDVVFGRERERLRRCRNGGAASDCAFAVANGVGTGTEPASFANRPIQPSRSNPPQPRGRRAPTRSAASANRLSR